MLKIGIIGSGSMGKWHTYGYDKIIELYDDIQIEKTVMCSRNLTEQRVSELGWKEKETDWHKVVTRPDIDIIDISAYDCLHYPIAKEALLNGKQVICEKPLADDGKQALELAELAREKKIRATVCTNYRYVHAIRCMKHLIDSGELGEIRHVYGSFLMDWAVNTENPMYWRLDDKCSPGGALGDLGTHLIDMCRFMGLEFVQVCGMNEVYGKQRKSGEEIVTTTANELCLFNARFQNDSLGLFELSRVSGGAEGMTFEIHGTKGSVRWGKNSINSLKVYIPDKICDGWGYKCIDANEILPYDYKWNHGFVQSDCFTLLFSDFLSNNGNAPDFSDGLKCCEIVDAVLRSDREKRCVCLRP